MKNIIFIGIMAASTMLMGCDKKAAHKNPQQAQNDGILAGMKQAASTSSAVVAYAVADASKSTNMVFTITEIWKGSEEGAAVGITNGMEIPYQYPSASIAYLPDAAIVTFTRGSGPIGRGMYFVRQGEVGGMTVQKFKSKIGL
ncbi:MAG: hypothetical protein ACLQSR_11360 [Limisphaerales bacterium]